MGGRRARFLALAISVGAAAIFFASAGFFWTSLPPTAGLLGNTPSWYADRGAGPPQLPTATWPGSLAGVRVAVLEDPENQRVTPPGFYSAEVAAWKRLLEDRGARYAPVSTADVLVLPYALCMSWPLRLLVARHLNAGKGVVTAGPIGSYGAHCDPTPDTFISQLLGGPGSMRLLTQPDSGSDYAVVLGESALGAGVPPGARMEIRPARQIVFRGAERGIYYADYMRAPVASAAGVGAAPAAPAAGSTSAAPAAGSTSAAASPEPYDGAVVRIRVGDGRAAAFGFALTHLVEGFSAEVGRTVATNAIRWAAGQPVLQIAPWPSGHSLAVVLAQDVEMGFENAQPVGQLVHARHAPATFFLLGTDAEAHEKLTKSLDGRVELGTHTVDHRALGGLPLDRQVRQLEWAQRQMTALIGHPVAGLRPPEERFDLATLRAWRAAGGAYVFASNNMRAAAPEIIPLGDDSIILLARDDHDDYHLLAQEGIRDREKLLARFLDGVRETADYRGLDMISFHSHLLGSPELRGVLASLVDGLRHDPGVWLADAADVATWWKARAHVRVTSGADAGTAVVVNDGSARVEGLVLLADLADGTRRRIDLPALDAGAQTVVVIQAPAAATGASAATDVAAGTR